MKKYFFCSYFFASINCIVGSLRNINTKYGIDIAYKIMIEDNDIPMINNNQ